MATDGTQEEIGSHPIIVDETAASVAAGLQAMRNEFASANMQSDVDSFKTFLNSDRVLTRFLRVMKWDPVRAAALFTSYCSKRAELFPDSLDAERIQPSDELLQTLRLGFVAAPSAARDLHDRRVLFFRPAHLNYSITTPELVAKAFFFVVDQCIINDTQAQLAGVVFVNNVAGFSRHQFRRATVKLVSEYIQNALPVRLGAVYIVNHPWFLGWIWVIISTAPQHSLL